MKKYMLMLMLCVFLAGCSSNGGGSQLSMNSFVEAYEAKGIEVDPAEKPMFGMIGAKDGIIFYNGNNPVKIYEFKSEKEIEEAKKTLTVIEDWDRNGLFLLETFDEESTTIFNDVK